MAQVDRKLFDPILKDKSDDYLKSRTSLFGWIFGIFPRHEFLRWHGDIRLHCTEERYQELTDQGPPVEKRLKFGYLRVAVEGAALDEYRRQFDKWIGR